MEEVDTVQRSDQLIQQPSQTVDWVPRKRVYRGWNGLDCAVQCVGSLLFSSGRPCNRYR
jgi:hypothetical protein